MAISPPLSNRSLCRAHVTSRISKAQTTGGQQQQQQLGPLRAEPVVGFNDTPSPFLTTRTPTHLDGVVLHGEAVIKPPEPHGNVPA